METNLYRDRGNWLPQQSWDRSRDNCFEQQGGFSEFNLNTANSFRFKPKITPEDLNLRRNAAYQHPLDITLPLNRNLLWSRNNKDLNHWPPVATQSNWNHKPVFPKDPTIQRSNQWPFAGSKDPWPIGNRDSWSAFGNKDPCYSAANKEPWAPSQDFSIPSKGYKPQWQSYQPFQYEEPLPKYRRESEYAVTSGLLANRGMLSPTCHPNINYSYQRSLWREQREHRFEKEYKFERESRKAYESRSRHRPPSSFKPEKKRHQNVWAREAAKALKEEKPSKFKEQQSTIVSGPRVEVMYLNKKCRASKLHEACNSDDLEKVKEILNQPTVELEGRDDIFWETPLMWAARLGKHEVVKAVFDKGASPWVANKDGFTLLHLAVLSGSIEVVKYIKEVMKIDVDHQDKSGKTALMLAAQRGNLGMVKYLIDSGANTELKSKTNANILLLAVESGNFELVKYILDNTQLARNINCLNTDEHTPLMLAASIGSEEICRLLIQHGANCNVIDPEGRTPLHAATEKGFSEVVECLLEQNSILHIQDRSGKTPVQIAVHRKHIPIALRLLEKGVSMDIPDKKGRNVLHIAAENGEMEIFRYLEKCNRKVYQTRTKQYWYTPIHCATKAGHLDVVQWLIQQGVDPDITDRDFNTPLHSAALEGHLDLVKFLIGAKVNINQRNKGGETPLHFAAMWNHLSVVEYLCENGADMNIHDSWGQTALQVAQKGNCSDALRYLEQKQIPQDALK